MQRRTLKCCELRVVKWWWFLVLTIRVVSNIRIVCNYRNGIAKIFNVTLWCLFFIYECTATHLNCADSRKELNAAAFDDILAQHMAEWVRQPFSYHVGKKSRVYSNSWVYDTKYSCTQSRSLSLIAFWNFIKKMAENSCPAVVWDCR